METDNHDQEHTVVDLNLNDIADDTLRSAEPPASQDDAESSRREPPPARRRAKSTSDDDLLADLELLDRAPEEATEIAHVAEEVVEGGEKKSGRRSRGTSPKPPVETKPDEDVEEDSDRNDEIDGDDLPNPEVMTALGAMPLDIVAVLGKKRMTVREIAALRAGSILAMDGDEDRLVDLVCQGKTLGKGELVMVDGKLGVRIVKYF